MSLEAFKKDINDTFSHLMVAALYYEKHVRVKSKSGSAKPKSRFNLDAEEPMDQDQWLARVYCDITALAQCVIDADGKTAIREALAMSEYLPSNLNLPKEYTSWFQTQIMATNTHIMSQSFTKGIFPATFRVLVQSHYHQYLQQKDSNPDALAAFMKVFKIILTNLVHMMAFVAVSDKKVYTSEIATIKNFINSYSKYIYKVFGTTISFDDELERVESYMCSVAKFKK